MCGVIVLSRTVIGILVALIAVIGSVTAYAMWSETLRINASVSTGEVDFEFLNGSLIYLDGCGLSPGYGYDHGNDWNTTYYPNSSATQLDKDVACTSAFLVDSDGDGDYDTLNITIHNAYPWYYTHIAFKVHNDGTIPIKLWRIHLNDTYYYEINAEGVKNGVEIDVNGDGEKDLRIWWGDNFGEQLHPCESVDISLDISVLQPAPENSNLNVLITFEAVQWNEYSVPTS